MHIELQQWIAAVLLGSAAPYWAGVMVYGHNVDVAHTLAEAVLQAGVVDVLLPVWRDARARQERYATEEEQRKQNEITEHRGTNTPLSQMRSAVKAADAAIVVLVCSFKT